MATRPQPPNMQRYKIDRYLTEGGMGAIYVGKKVGPGGFEKEVVLKQLLPEFTQRPEFRDLFFREAKITATLDHANIVHTFDLVESDGSLFIVMEFVRGTDLRTLVRRARIRRQELSVAAAIQIILEVLAGLSYAHTRRAPNGAALEVIHRDVSPSNILCSAQGEVKISDFGIARVATNNSVFYRVRGKVGYMSPEQARNEELDARSDLYSVAVCLWETLSGERLFVGDLNTPPEEIYSQPIPPISSKRRGTPPGLDEVMDMALAPTPGARFQDAAAFAEALRNVAHRAGLGFSAPDLAQHLHAILGSNPDRWLHEDTTLPEMPDTAEIALRPKRNAGPPLEGKEAASLGVVDPTGSYVLSEIDLMAVSSGALELPAIASLAYDGDDDEPTIARRGNPAAAVSEPPVLSAPLSSPRPGATAPRPAAATARAASLDTRMSVAMPISEGLPGSPSAAARPEPVVPQAPRPGPPKDHTPFLAMPASEPTPVFTQRLPRFVEGGSRRGPPGWAAFLLLAAATAGGAAAARALTMHDLSARPPTAVSTPTPRPAR